MTCFRPKVYYPTSFGGTAATAVVWAWGEQERKGQSAEKNERGEHVNDKKGERGW